MRLRGSQTVTCIIIDSFPNWAQASNSEPTRDVLLLASRLQLPPHADSLRPGTEAFPFLPTIKLPHASACEPAETQGWWLASQLSTLCKNNLCLFSLSAPVYFHGYRGGSTEPCLHCASHGPQPSVRRGPQRRPEPCSLPSPRHSTCP